MTSAWADQWILWGKRVIAVPQVLALLLAVDLAAYVAGLIFWYGSVMTNPATPMWAWPFIPDCPLFGLLGALGLSMVLAQQWSLPAQRQARRTVAVMAAGVTLVWLSTYVPGVGVGWAEQAGMFGVLGGSLIVTALFFHRAPAWLLGIFAFGQIKYGIWTVTAWMLYWKSTTAILGAPDFSFDSISMTVAHIGLFAQGVFLLTYFRPTRTAALAALVWFGLSDYMDYGKGFYPAIPEQLISLDFMQWSTILVTATLSGIYFLLAPGRKTASTDVQEANHAAHAV